MENLNRIRKRREKAKINLLINFTGKREWLRSFPFRVFEMDFIQATESILGDLLKDFDPDKAWIEAVESATPLILELLTKKQLGNEGEGIDGDGNSLGDYAPFTVNIRQSFGLQTDHISLEFTGQFLRGMDVLPTLTGWRIIKDEDRYEELTVDLNFPESIIDLTKENEQIVFEEIRRNYGN